MRDYSFKKTGFIILGSISLGLGIIGIVFPVLPTTPFLLLTAFCYLRGSNRMYNWLIGHRVFGSYIYNYMTHKAVSRNVKIGAMVFLWFTLIFSSLLISSFYIRIFLVIVGVSVSIHLITLKTMRSEDIQTAELNNEEQ